MFVILFSEHCKSGTEQNIFISIKDQFYYFRHIVYDIALHSLKGNPDTEYTNVNSLLYAYFQEFLSLKENINKRNVEITDQANNW